MIHPNTEVNPETYYFKSYNDAQGTTLWGTGTVETTGTKSDGYTEVEVLSNDTDESFVGQKFYITSDAVADGNTLYQLYSDVGVTGVGIYVKVSSSAFTQNINFVVDDGSDAIQGAVVTIGEITGTTGSAGGCTLQNVSEGEHSVTVTADGFTSKTETITVSESDTTFTISLEAE